MANPLRLIIKQVKYDVVYAKMSTGIYMHPSVPQSELKHTMFIQFHPLPVLINITDR
jgi:hypothetical protein